MAGGYEEAKGGGGLPIRRTRIPVVEFAAAIRLGSKMQNRRLENDEVECLLANMIYKVGTSHPHMFACRGSTSASGQHLAAINQVITNGPNALVQEADNRGRT